MERRLDLGLAAAPHARPAVPRRAGFTCEVFVYIWLQEMERNIDLGDCLDRLAIRTGRGLESPTFDCRDRLLVELDAVFPGYGLARHKGYCSREHLAALQRISPELLAWLRRKLEPSPRF